MRYRAVELILEFLHRVCRGREAAPEQLVVEAAEQPLRGGQQLRVVVVQHRRPEPGGGSRGHRAGERAESAYP